MTEGIFEDKNVYCYIIMVFQNIKESCVTEGVPNSGNITIRFKNVKETLFDWTYTQRKESLWLY